MSNRAQQAVPAEQRCVWPGCTRRRAAGRATGSGRQKEYCLQADPPESGGSPVHNARNRWASLRSAANRAAQYPADRAEDADGDGTQGIESDGAGSAGKTTSVESGAMDTISVAKAQKPARMPASGQ